MNRRHRVDTDFAAPSTPISMPTKLSRSTALLKLTVKIDLTIRLNDFVDLPIGAKFRFVFA